MHTSSHNYVSKRSLPAVLLLMTAALGGCTAFEYHETKIVNIERVDESQEAQMNESLLLDIGVVLFDDGVDVLDDISAAYSSVRQSEAVWFSSQLASTLERSNAWGGVRTLPNANSIIDVMVKGKLLESNGEIVHIRIQVEDASGKQWFVKDYSQRASSYAYSPEVNLPQDPFQAMFNEMANDLFAHLRGLEPAALSTIRHVAKIRFARDFVPQAFDDYLATGEEGALILQRVPASSDPVMQRVARIQARNDLFLDVIQDYYRTFNKKMALPYKEWRKLSYKEVIYERQLREQARKEKLTGVVAMVGGLVAAVEGNSRTTRGAGHIGLFGGAQLFAKSFSKADEASMHSETLREMGASLESELEPNVIDLQDRSVTLSGTVEDQFQEWRRILTRMFEIDQGVPSTQQTTADIKTLPDSEVSPDAEKSGSALDSQNE